MCPLNSSGLRCTHQPTFVVAYPVDLPKGDTKGVLRVGGAGSLFESMCFDLALAAAPSFTDEEGAPVTPAPGTLWSTRTKKFALVMDMEESYKQFKDVRL